MRILVLSKRQYTGKDLLDDRYGRLFEIPAALAGRGHEVLGVALSYRRRAEGWRQWADRPRLRWYSVNATPWGWFRYPSQLGEIARGFQPELIWACSDAPHALIGWGLKNKLHCPLVIDLYDNFESFGLTRLPGMTPLLRAACRHADGLSLVSRTLENYVRANYGIAAPHIVIGNGVRTELFYPRSKTAARRMLGLPEAGRLIGTAGSIRSDRGIADLFKAFLHLAEQDKNLWLVYAGPRDATPNSYRNERIIDLGELDQEKIPHFFSALDVAVICNRDSMFGRYCFPQKLFEIVACRTPMVVAEVGDVASLLREQPYSLYPPGDHIALAERLACLLREPTHQYDLAVATWQQRATELGNFFLSLVKR